MKIHFRDIKKGDVFWECQYGRNIKCVALENAYLITEEDEDETGKSPGYHCRVNISFEGDPNTGGEMSYFEAESPGAYGLRLYSEPQYIQRK